MNPHKASPEKTRCVSILGEIVFVLGAETTAPSSSDSMFRLCMSCASQSTSCALLHPSASVFDVEVNENSHLAAFDRLEEAEWVTGLDDRLHERVS